MYKIVTWFTECPYFNLFVSICGILSAAAIVNFVYFKKEKPIAPYKIAAEITDILIDMAGKYDDFWLPFGSEDANDFQNLSGRKIDYSHSFFIMPNHSLEFPMFALVKTDNSLRLYGCLDITKSSYRLIATSSNVPALKKLLDLASTVENLSNDEFSKQILSKLKRT